MANIDDYLGTVTTTGILTTIAPVYGIIDFKGDQDWFKTTLTAGVTYTFNLVQTPKSQFYNLDSYLRLLNSRGQTISFDDDSGGTRNAWIRYTPATSGDYFLSAEGNYYSFLGVVTGSYELSVWANHAPVVTGNAVSVGVGQSVALSSLFSATDPDGNSIVAYKFHQVEDVGTITIQPDLDINWDQASRTLTVPASALGGVKYSYDVTVGGIVNMQISASDGALWSNWANAPITLLSQTVAAPTITADQIFLAVGENVKAAGIVRVMADFAKAAYDLQWWEHPVINDYSPNAAGAKKTVWSQGWAPLNSATSDPVTDGLPIAARERLSRASGAQR